MYAQRNSSLHHYRHPGIAEPRDRTVLASAPSVLHPVPHGCSPESFSRDGDQICDQTRHQTSLMEGGVQALPTTVSIEVCHAGGRWTWAVLRSAERLVEGTAANGDAALSHARAILEACLSAGLEAEFCETGWRKSSIRLTDHAA